MIWLLNVRSLIGDHMEQDWKGVIEIDLSASLKTLHYAIQSAVNFNNDHLYNFYVAKRPRARNVVCYELDEYNHGESKRIEGTTLKDIFPLEKGNKLFYLFDYGDRWLFSISQSRKKPFDPVPGVIYPRLQRFEGDVPIQYPAWNND